MTMTQVQTTQVYEVYIKAPVQKVWDAITDPEWTQKYAYQARQEIESRAGGTFKTFATDEMRGFGLPEVIITGEVIEYDPPRKLVHTWLTHFSDELSAEPPTRLTYELAEAGDCTRLTLVHELENAPLHAEMVASQWSEEGGGGGWTWILSDLKSLLETGQSMFR